MLGPWFFVQQTFLLIILRRFRTIPMLLMLALLFCLMSLKANWVLGAPYLFWHDDVLGIGFLSLLAVGLFLEEWAFVAVLLDTDENNPINSSLPGNRGSKISLIASVKAHLRIDTSISEVMNNPEDEESNVIAEPRERELTGHEKALIFSAVRKIHSVATYSLAFLFGFLTAFYYQWNNEHLIPIWGSTFLTPFSIGVILTGFVYLLFLVRRLILWGAKPLTQLCRFVHWLIGKIPWIGKPVANWIFVEVLDDKSLFRRFHLIAFFKNFLAISYIAVITSLFWYGISADSQVTVAFIVCTVFSMFLGFYGWIVFQRRRMRYEFVASILLLAAIASLWGLQNVPQQVRLFHDVADKRLPDDPNSALKEIKKRALIQIDRRLAWKKNIVSESATHKPSPRSEESILNAWKKHASQSRFSRDGDINESRKPVLVLVSNTGGGIKAQVWSSLVLSCLENKFAQPDANGIRTHFSRHVRLISGASGGMVGAGYWTATLDNYRTFSNRQENSQVYFHKDAQSEWMTTESMIEKMASDCLSPVARQGFYNDFLGLPLRLTGIDHLFEKSMRPRGEALENTLIKNGPAFDTKFRELAAGELEGWRPTLIFTPTSATDGRRFLICNQPLEYLFYARFDKRNDKSEVTKSDAEKEKIIRADSNDLESNPIYSWRINYPTSDMKLATAARLSANFPVFIDSPFLPFGNGTDQLRIMDAGYTDNHGLYPVAAWINENKEWIKKYTSGLLLVEISASPLPRIENPNPEGSLAPEALGFVTTSFNKSLYHSDRLLSLAGAELNTKEDPDFFRIETFAYGGEASLSWFLSPVEKLSLIYPFLSDSQVAQLLNDRNVKATESISLDLIKISSEDITESKLITGADLYPDARYQKSEQERETIGTKLKQLQTWWDSRHKD